MFGNKKRKAVDHVTERLRPLMGIISHNYGIPERFWDDEFVLGFMLMMVSFHLNETSGLRMSQTDKGFVMTDVFSNLSNLNGAAISRRAVDLAMQDPKSPDFELGGDNAHICAYASLGKVSDVGRPHVEAAKEIAAMQGNERDIGLITGALLQSLFFRPLAERFEWDV
jgi:hypothetical protein